MSHILARFSIAGRLWLFVGFAAACLVALSTASLREMHARTTEERRAKARATVDAAYGVIARFGTLAETGKTSRAEAQRAAIETIGALRYEEREYFWINDLEPRMVMHPTQPDLNGKPLGDYRDPQPGSHEPVRKTSYVRLYAPWGWIVGTGIYLDDLDAALAADAGRLFGATALAALLLGVAAFVVARNIKRSEEALRQAEEALRLSVEHAPIGVALVAVDGHWLRVNRALCEILGYSADELLKLTFGDITHLDDLGSSLSSIENLLRGKVPQYSLAKRYLRKDGRVVDAMLHVAVVRDKEGRPRHLVAHIEDVTEQKRVQAQLTQRDRMASLGTLSAGVAHEINNPLAYIKLNLDLISEQLRDPHAPSAACDLREVAEMVEEAREGAERVRRIVQGLKSFSRTDEERRIVLDVRCVLEKSINLTFNEIRHRARLVRDFGDVPHVDADESMLVQVFTNLLVNATQAIPEGQAERNEIRIVTRRDGLGRALIEVRDTGCGISEAEVGRIFEPFFTTKPVGMGTGLGLSVCHGILASLGGEIAAESTEGKGTTLRVTLPASRKAAQPPAAVIKTEAKVFKRGRVLIVDDEPLVAEALRRALVHEHDVTVLASGEDALKCLLGNSRFDVILCDLMMPQMTGMELHARLMQAGAEQTNRIVFATGGAFTSSARAFLDRVPNERIEKPFELQDVRALVRRFQSA